MLQFPKDPLVQDHSLLVGSHLLTVNTYKMEDRIDTDLIQGPLTTNRWSGFIPIIADFVTDDMERLRARKREIDPSSEWERHVVAHVQQLKQVVAPKCKQTADFI